MIRHRVLGTLRGLCLLPIFAAAAITGGIVLTYDRSMLTRARWLGFWSRICNWLLGMQVKIGGAVPSNGMLVSNHLGYMDVLALSASVPCMFVAKREVGTWPVFGFFARMAGTIYVDRENRSDVVRVNGLIERALDEGIVVVLFAEGTSSDGSRVLPFKSALLQPIVEKRPPLTAGAISYPKAVCYCGKKVLGPHLLNTLTIARTNIRVQLKSVEAPSMARKKLAELMHEEVSQLHRQLASEICEGPLFVNRANEKL